LPEGTDDRAFEVSSSRPEPSPAGARSPSDKEFSSLPHFSQETKCFWDLTRTHSCAFSLVVNQALFVLLAYTLVQAHLVLRRRQELTGGVWERTWQLLSPSLEVVAVYYRQRFCLLTLAEFGGILLDIPEPVRGKLRDKLRRIEREQYSLLENARPP